MAAPSHSFICYSSADGRDFATRLAAALEGGDPAFGVWFDVYEKQRNRLRPGEDWDDQIAEGIRTCENLLFVMTADSTRSNSECKREWTRALRYKKPVIPIWAQPGVEMPFRLEPREGIEGSFEDVLARLRSHLAWSSTPAGVLQALRYRLLDAERALARAQEPEDVARIQSEIAELKRQIETQSELSDDPARAAQRTSERIEAGIRTDREAASSGARARTQRFVNAPPAAAPSYFQDRFLETDWLLRSIAEDARRICWVVGRGGMGKTALACRVLKGLEEGRLSDGRAVTPLETIQGHTGIVYLSAVGSRRIAWHILYEDLCRLLPQPEAESLLADFKKPQSTVAQKMSALLDVFARGRVIVMLDNFEDVIDPQSQQLRDADLSEAIVTLLKHPVHAIKLLITTRVVPSALVLEQPAAHARLDLVEGLPSPYAETILRELDSDGTLGLKSAPDALLSQARELTRGNPRGLEALYASLSADRDTTLQELLAECTRQIPENVTNALVGEAFARLDTHAQEVIQALALYGRPVSAAAVDYLLQAHRPGVASADILRRLVNMHFVRKEDGRYYLHAVDARHARDRIPTGTVADRTDPSAVYSRFALLHRAADYFLAIRAPQEEWRTIADLTPLLAEFELRVAGEDFETAAGVLQAMETLLSNESHYRIARDLHRQLEGKLTNPEWTRWNLACLASAESRLVDYEAAISHYATALELARAHEDSGYLHSCLYGLAWCYSEIGDLAAAVAHVKEALEVAQRTGVDAHITDDLSILGWYFAKQGNIADALKYAEQAVEHARKNAADRVGLAYALTNWSGVLIDADRHAESLSPARECLATVDVVNLKNWTNGFLALAHLMLDEIPQARAAAELAVANDEPENNANVQVLLGIVAARQRDTAVAIQAFTTAVKQAEQLLEYSPRNYHALDAMAVAWAGLAVCGRSEGMSSAVAAHQRARAISSDAGVIARISRLYRALAPADAHSLLPPIVATAQGKNG